MQVLLYYQFFCWCFFGKDHSAHRINIVVTNLETHCLCTCIWSCALGELIFLSATCRLIHRKADPRVGLLMGYIVRYDIQPPSDGKDRYIF
jgi:hypothetical protein